MASLKTRYKHAMQDLSPMSDRQYEMGLIYSANDLVVDLANGGQDEDAEALAERIHLLTGGWVDKIYWTVDRIIMKSPTFSG